MHALMIQYDVFFHFVLYCSCNGLWYTAPDAKERQKWITHLRAAVDRVSNLHTSTPQQRDISPVCTPTTSLPTAPTTAVTTGDEDHTEHLALQRTPSKRTSLTRLFKTTKNTINR